MERKIKVIWEFSGPEAEETAKHHKIHLDEFSQREGLNSFITGTEYVNHIAWLAYLIVLEKDVLTVRDALKPLRAELFED